MDLIRHYMENDRLRAALNALMLKIVMPRRATK